jgi:hypothetical protein
MTTPGIAPDVLYTALQDDTFWSRYIQQALTPNAQAVSLHLAILVNPYLQRLLDGQKTIESRFSIQRRAPYEQVQAGDVVLLKQSGRPIRGIGLVSQVWFYELTPPVLQHIQTTYADELGIDDPGFWAARTTASFATLMRLDHVSPIAPIVFTKRDQRAWVVLQRRIAQQPLWSGVV